MLSQLLLILNIHPLMILHLLLLELFLSILSIPIYSLFYYDQNHTIQTLDHIFPNIHLYIIPLNLHMPSKIMHIQILMFQSFLNYSNQIFEISLLLYYLYSLCLLLFCLHCQRKCIFCYT